MVVAQRRLELRREEILDAAERIFAEKGYHEAGIADIAQLLGLGHGTFYRYFKNKHDIALQVFDRLLGRLAEIGLAEDPARTNTLDAYRSQTRDILQRWVGFFDEHPHALRFFRERSITIDPQRMDRLMEAYVARTALFLQNGVDKGFLRASLDVTTTAEMLVTLILEGTYRSARLPDGAARLRHAEAGIALMFDGIAARGGRGV